MSRVRRGVPEGSCFVTNFKPQPIGEYNAPPCNITLLHFFRGLEIKPLVIAVSVGILFVVKHDHHHDWLIQRQHRATINSFLHLFGLNMPVWTVRVASWNCLSRPLHSTIVKIQPQKPQGRRSTALLSSGLNGPRHRVVRAICLSRTLQHTKRCDYTPTTRCKRSTSPFISSGLNGPVGIGVRFVRRPSRMRPQPDLLMLV